ncbi:unnamed protein product [Effrenium voratum]|nr:unnamed protein product [Effrenium voratum]
MQMRALQAFLQKHKFKDLSIPRSTGFAWWFGEKIYPIHVAASLGDYHLLRLMLAVGADPEQKTSKGRLPLDFALRADQTGSHRDVVGLLMNRVKVVAMREFHALARSQSGPVEQPASPWRKAAP